MRWQGSGTLLIGHQSGRGHFAALLSSSSHENGSGGSEWRELARKVSEVELEREEDGERPLDFNYQTEVQPRGYRQFQGRFYG